MHVHEGSLQSVECNVTMEHWNGILEWNAAMTNLKLVVIRYRIAQLCGEGKYWRIWRIDIHLPMFYLPVFSLP